MRIISKILLCFTLLFSFVGPINAVFAADPLDVQGDARDGAADNFAIKGVSSFGAGFSDFFTVSKTGEGGAYAFLLKVAKDAKDFMTVIAIIFLTISALKLLFAKGGDDDVKKWKKSILWTSVGVIFMQIAYMFVSTLYNKNINGKLAWTFLENIIYPFVSLLNVLASFLFLAMMFIAFFQMVTAGGNEEGVKKGKNALISGLIGFVLIKIPQVLVWSIYGKANDDCSKSTGINLVCQLTDPNISDTISIATKIVNYVNGFLIVITVLLIIYAGFLVLMSGGEEEGMKKAKGIIKYIAIGFGLLIASYILFNFFILKG